MPHNGELCQNCFKHERGHNLNHGIRKDCDDCLPADKSLRRCNACKLIRYCSRECQKQHWKEHKPACDSNVRVRQVRKKLGPIVAERQRSHEKWCQKNGQWISHAALSALEIKKDWTRIDTQVFVLYVDVEQIPPSPDSPNHAFRRSLRSASSVPLSRVHQMFDHRMGYDGLEIYLAPHAQVMRVLIIDDGLPQIGNLDLYTLPVRVALADPIHPFNHGWYRDLKRRVDDEPM